MSGSRGDWFPTSVWHFDIENYQQLNQKLLQAINQEQERDHQGVHWSNVLGWHSVDNLNQRSEFQEFLEIVYASATEVASFVEWDLRKVKLVVSNCWANVNFKYASNAIHNHPNAILSGVYYVQAPENCGGIFFRDPRELAHMISPPVKELTAWTLQKVTYNPVEGRLIIFPSWLLHGVDPNLNDEARISISFNIGMVGI